MADAIQRAYRTAFLRYVEENQPIEIKSRGKESIFGMPYKPHTTLCENIIKTTTKEIHE